MRYMRWSYADLVACPQDYVEVIAQLNKDEVALSKPKKKA